MDGHSGPESSPPAVSVVIPVWNDAERLRFCLQALESQTYAEDRYEVIVVDNGSDTPVQPLVARYPHAHVVVESRPGSYQARNTGVAVATGAIVAFTDADCIPAEDWLERGVRALLGAPGCGLVGGRIDVFARDEAHPTAVELHERVFAFPQRRYVTSSRFAATANAFTFRSVLDAVGPFNTNHRSGGDLEWGQRVAAASYGLVYADDARVAHPARRSLRDLHRKVTRTRGGVYELARSQGTSSPWRLVRLTMRSLLPVKALLRLRREPRVSSVVDRMKVGAVIVVGGYITAWEDVRLRLGGSSRR